MSSMSNILLKCVERTVHCLLGVAFILLDIVFVRGTVKEFVFLKSLASVIAIFIAIEFVFWIVVRPLQVTLQRWMDLTLAYT